MVVENNPRVIVSSVRQSVASSIAQKGAPQLTLIVFAADRSTNSTTSERTLLRLTAV